MEVQDSIKELVDRFPGRSAQIFTLQKLMGNSTDPVVPSVFIYGYPSSGKTSIIQSICERMLSRSMWAYINCIECHTPRMLFEKAFNQWCSWTPSWDNGFMNVCKVDNVHQFVKMIQTGFHVTGKRYSIGEEETHYLILDKAERLRDLSPGLVPVLLRLSEMTNKNVCVILLSTVVFEKFRIKGGVYEPLLIRFPDYSKEDTLRILQMDFSAPSDRLIPLEYTTATSSDDNDQPNESIKLDDAFISSFTDIIYSIFNHNCKDLNELRYFAALLFPLYIKPLQDGRAQEHETSKLYKYAHPYFAEAIDKLYLREISSAEWSQETLNMSTSKPNNEEGTARQSSFLTQTRSRNRVDFELPYYTKFLLLASYLASYNPAKFDVRYFAKASEERRRKKGGGTRKGRATEGRSAAMRQQLLGPKAFPVERMLAIFYSIIGDTLDDTIDIQLQITSLTTLRLLVRTSKVECLDAAKYKCNVSFEFIRTVAKSVRFEVEKYLYNFS